MVSSCRACFRKVVRRRSFFGVKAGGGSNRLRGRQAGRPSTWHGLPSAVEEEFGAGLKRASSRGLLGGLRREGGEGGREGRTVGHGSCGGRTGIGARVLDTVDVDDALTWKVVLPPSGMAMVREARMVFMFCLGERGD